MEEKVRYQYSCFIYPFKVNNYENYINSLLNNKNITLDLREKEKDMELYTYFLPSVRNYFFGSLNWEKQQKKDFEDMNNNLKKSILAKMGTCFFTYKLGDQIYGKIGEGDIFFIIDTIQIVCTKLDTCFLLLKTHIENVEKIEQVLDFNYKFKEINTIQEELKNYEKIRIQTTQFETTKEIQTLLKELTMQEEIPLPYIHSYVCIDSENWSDASSFENIKPSYNKFINVQPKQANLNLNSQKELLLDLDYIKMSTSNEGTFLMASSVQSQNYTKLPDLFEKQYLYTFLIRLEQKEILNSSFEKQTRNWQNVVARDRITEDEVGSKLYEKLRNIWDLDTLEKRAQKYQESLFQKEEIVKNKKWNKILTVILIVSILLNLYNLVINLRNLQ